MSQRWPAVGAPLLALLLLGLSPSPAPPFSDPSTALGKIFPHSAPPKVAPCSQIRTRPQPEQTNQRPRAHTPTLTYTPQSEEPGQPSLLPSTKTTPPNAPPPPSDTLRTSATTDTPLILSLPATLNDTPVTRYTVLQGPSLSGVADRSFTWIPRGTESGTYDISLHAHHPDAAPDTLVLRIDLQP